MGVLNLPSHSGERRGYAREVFFAFLLSMVFATRAFAGGTTVVSQPLGRTDTGIQRFQFPTIPSGLASAFYFADLDLVAANGTAISPADVRVGFNGIAPDEAALLGQLTYRHGTVVRVGVGAVGWRDLSFARLFRTVQRDGKRLTLTVSGVDQDIREARLVFRTLSVFDFVPPFVDVRLNGPDRDGWTVRGDNVSASFAAWPGAVSYRCRLDGGRWERCEDGWNSGRMTNGWHRIDVRGWNSVGFSGFATPKWIYLRPPVEPPAPVIVVKNVDPSAALHNVAQVRVIFHRVNATPANEGFCQIDEGALAPCTSPVTVADFAEGRHQFRIRGAMSGAAQVVEWTTDRTPPVANFANFPPEITSTDEANFFFRADEAATFQCALDEDSFQTCEAATSFEDLADGAHVARLIATDHAGNASAVVEYRWTVDTTAPDAPSVIADPPGAILSTGEISISFSGSEPNLVFECRLDGSEAVSCRSPWTLSGLVEGEHVVQVVAVDLLGHASDPAEYRWAIVTTAPDLVLTRNLPVKAFSRDTTASFNIDAGGALFECRLDGLPAPSCDTATQFEVGEGTHRFEARSLGAGGITGPWMLSEWTVDLTAPVLSLDYAGLGSLTTSSSFTVTFSADDAATVICELDGVVSSCTSPFSVNGLADGPHAFTLRATDTVGNESTESKNWVVDTLAPVVTLTNLTPGWTPTQSRTLTVEFSMNDSSATAECKFDSGAWVLCSSPWQLAGVVDGDHTASVRAKDPAGNISAAKTHAWTVAAPFPITEVTVIPLSVTSVRISWRTSIPSTRQVAYGAGTQSGGYTLSQSTTENPTLLIVHQVTITGLTADTAYVAQPRSRASSGTLSVADPVEFRTPRP